MRVAVLLEALAVLAAAQPARAQSLLYRSPNLSGDWVAPPGLVQFNFIHRFYVSPGPSRTFINYPTFTFATGVAGGVGLGFRFATKSAFLDTLSSSNESEVYARWRFLGGTEGTEGLSASVSPAYNFRAKSVDGELAASYTRGPITVLGAVRELGKPFGASGAQTALGGGAVLRLNRYVALSGDVARLLGGDTTAAWSAALQVAIPGSPHTFALEVSNVAGNTYQGGSRGLRGTPSRLYGFEFTIPLDLRRFGAWFHPSAATATGATGTAAAQVDVASFRFGTDTVRVAAGQIVRWVNHDPLDHSVTFEAEGPVSGPIPAGGSYAVKFDRPGVYPYHCTPHPYMKGVVVVQ